MYNYYTSIFLNKYDCLKFVLYFKVINRTIIFIYDHSLPITKLGIGLTCFLRFTILLSIVWWWFCRFKFKVCFDVMLSIYAFGWDIKLEYCSSCWDLITVILYSFCKISFISATYSDISFSYRFQWWPLLGDESQFEVIFEVLFEIDMSLRSYTQI